MIEAAVRASLRLIGYNLGSIFSTPIIRPGVVEVWLNSEIFSGLPVKGRDQFVLNVQIIWITQSKPNHHDGAGREKGAEGPHCIGVVMLDAPILVAAQHDAAAVI